MTARILRLGLHTPLVAALLLSSGCVTEALWQVEPASRLVVVSEHHVDAAIDVMADFEVSDDLLVDARRTDGEPLPTTSGFVSPQSFWRLEPGRGAVEARALLERPGDFEVQRIDVQMRRDVVDERVDCRAELAVEARVVRPIRAVAIDSSVLAIDVEQAILPIGDNDLLFDHAAPAGSDDLLIECARRLRALDSRLWLPSGRDTSRRLVGCVWRHADGRLLTDEARAELLRDFAMDGPSDGHLDGLAQLQLLAVVAGSEGREFFALQPDQIWLWSSLDIEGDRVLHRSEWLPRPVTKPDENYLIALGDGAMQFDYLAGWTERDVAGTVAIQVALTPATVVIDSLLYILESWVIYPGKHRDGRPPARRWR